MKATEIKKRLRDFQNRLQADYEVFNHLQQFSQKLDEAEKILIYMEEKYLLKLERTKKEAAPKIKKALEASESNTDT